MPYAITQKADNLAPWERGPLVTMVADLAALDDWMIPGERYIDHEHHSVSQSEYDAWIAESSKEDPAAIKATAQGVGATHLQRTSVGLFLVRYSDAEARWESLPIRPDGSLFHEDWTEDSGFDPAGDGAIALARGTSVAAQREVVGAVLKEYHRRVGYREWNFITHFEWISETEFRVYQTCNSHSNMDILLELAGQRPSEGDRPERFFKRRTMNIMGGWSKDWVLIPVDQVDLTQLIPASDRPDRLTIQRWHSAILFDILGEIRRDMVSSGGLVQRQIDAIARTIEDARNRSRDDYDHCFATIKDFLLGATPAERSDRRRRRKASAKSSLDNYPALLTEIFAGGDQPILTAIVREAADAVYGCRLN